MSKQIDNSIPLLTPTGEGNYILNTVEDDEEHPGKVKIVASKEAHPSDLIRLLVERIPVESMADSHHGIRLLELVRKDDDGEPCPDKLKIEDADYSWLMKRLGAAGPKALGLMASRLKDALEPMSHAKRKKDRKKAKQEEAEED